ncbi:hypothetical protein [Verrucomicrobium spinosum]|uniref:hypothetical protein n=1 Tax=Verrucomicrobium spinosum TaxID=2736 RepID=UPI000B23156F|nr:hypothetical protein [Verrucomicrobium spinosum]
MNAPLTLSTGFVPSLEAIPLLAATRSVGAPWRMHPCPSYGRIIRHLLTGELAAGLIPWELGVTELVTKPGRKASGACHSSCMPVPWNWCSRPRP